MSRQGISGHCVQVPVVRRNSAAIMELALQARALHRKLIGWAALPYTADVAIETAIKELLKAEEAIRKMAPPTVEQVAERRIA